VIHFVLKLIADLKGALPMIQWLHFMMLSRFFDRVCFYVFLPADVAIGLALSLGSGPLWEGVRP
jgi:hypothetical protein